MKINKRFIYTVELSDIELTMIDMALTNLHATYESVDSEYMIINSMRDDIALIRRNGVMEVDHNA